MVEWMLVVGERKKTRRREKGGQIASFVLPPVSAVAADWARSRCWRFARKERQKTKQKRLGRRAKNLLVKARKNEKEEDSSPRSTFCEIRVDEIDFQGGTLEREDVKIVQSW